MNTQLVLKKSILIDSSLQRVWEALTRPELIKQYFFGTQVTCDWKVGSPILFSGQWEGKSYEDKGVVLKFVPEKTLEYSYWSEFSGLPDVPENYSIATYEIAPEGASTLVTVTQKNFADQTAYEHSDQGFTHVMNGLKNLLEKKASA